MLVVMLECLQLLTDFIEDFEVHDFTMFFSQTHLNDDKYSYSKCWPTKHTNTLKTKCIRALG